MGEREKTKWEAKPNELFGQSKDGIKAHKQNYLHTIWKKYQILVLQIEKKKPTTQINLQIKKKKTAPRNES